MTANLEVLGLTLLASGLVVALGLLAFRWLAGRSVAAAAVLVAVVPVLAFVAGLMATAQAMFISDHDLGVTLVVCLVAGAVATTAGVVLSVRVRELQRQLAARDEELERDRRVEASRRDLVAGVSHDLRTPLAGLRAMAEALEDGMADDPERYHRQMQVEVDRLSRLVDDLFELSRLQSGAMSLSLELVSVEDVVSDTLAAADGYARTRGVHVQGSATTTAKILGDERELHRALSNLVRNAIRHTPSDGVVHVSAAQRGGSVVLAVADGCGGIPEPDLEHVFDIAWRGDEARTPNTDGGSGLGLAIVRGIAEAHKGAVAVTNAAAGCRFEVVLPAAPSGSRPTMADSPA
jgi:signal transduction histidine kinase